MVPDPVDTFDQLEYELEACLSEQQRISSSVSNTDASKTARSFEGTNALLRMALASRKRLSRKARFLHACAIKVCSYIYNDASVCFRALAVDVFASISSVTPQ